MRWRATHFPLCATLEIRFSDEATFSTLANTNQRNFLSYFYDPVGNDTPCQRDDSEVLKVGEVIEIVITLISLVAGSLFRVEQVERAFVKSG